MSADLSDPHIGAAASDIATKASSWLLLHYPSDPSSASQIVLLCSGSTPVVEGWRELIARGEDEVLFGYGEIDGKGLVLLYLTDKVGGVRRARAIVHSRAVAQLFPDHQALLTIGNASQLTEEAAREKLGFYHPPGSNLDTQSSTPSSHPLPPVPVAQDFSALPASVSSQFSDSPHERGHSGPTVIELNDHAVTAMSQGTPALNHELAPPIHWGDSQTVPDSPSENEPPRNRSLSSRFKGIPFRSTSGTPSPSTPTGPEPNDFQPSTPSSPTGSRFKSSSLAKAFRRRRRSSASGGTTPPGSVPTSPQVPDSGARDPPAVPPKDSFTRQPDNNGLFGTDVSAAQEGSDKHGYVQHPSGGISYTPPVSTPIQTVSSSTTLESQRLGVEKINLSPSPSASKALFDVRQKNILQENEIQEKFRRDQEDRERKRVEGREVVDDEEEGLPYDREEAEVPTSPVQPSTTTDRPASLSALSPEDQAAADRLAAAALAHAERVKADRELEEARVEAEKVEINRRRLIEVAEAETRRVEEQRQRLEEERRLEAEHQARLLEEERVRIREKEERIETARIEAERLHRERVEAEEKLRQAEEEKRLAEEEALRVQAEVERKRAVREKLMRGKREGSVMLSGWLTVQNTQSMIWRRRWFQLYPTELRLYKAENDPSPIQTIRLGSGQVSQTYEESQVKGSFKVVSDSTDFYMFTDSPEDKEVVLEGLGIAMS